MSNFFRVQLPYEKWFGLSGNEDFLASNPFYLSTDGLLIVAKDKSLIERDLTEAEKKAFGCDEFENAIFVTTNSGKRGHMPKEKAMKINVKKKMKSPMDGGFEILMPEDKGKIEESKEEVNGDVDIKDYTCTEAISTADTTLGTDNSTMSKDINHLNGNTNKVLNGMHENGVSQDVDMHNGS